MLWYQGLSEAPVVVRKCVASWVRENPGWEVVVLDKDSLGNYIVADLPDEKLAGLSLTKRSNLVRLQLLAEYGGVWADATTYCMKPLDDWLDGCTTSGFFAFHKPGPDRLLATWFIACEKGCPLVVKLRERYASFFLNNRFAVETRFKQEIVSRLGKYFNRSERTTRYWFSPAVTKLLRVYPYFIFHYMFERLVASDSECRVIWENTRKLSADVPHGIQMAGLFSPLDERIKKQIDEAHAPLYKLTWKEDRDAYAQFPVMHYLFDGRAGSGSPGGLCGGCRAPLAGQGHDSGAAAASHPARFVGEAGGAR